MFCGEYPNPEINCDGSEGSGTGSPMRFRRVITSFQSSQSRSFQRTSTMSPVPRPVLATKLVRSVRLFREHFRVFKAVLVETFRFVSSFPPQPRNSRFVAPVTSSVFRLFAQQRNSSRLVFCPETDTVVRSFSLAWAVTSAALLEISRLVKRFPLQYKVVNAVHPDRFRLVKWLSLQLKSAKTGLFPRLSVLSQFPWQDNCAKAVLPATSNVSKSFSEQVNESSTWLFDTSSVVRLFSLQYRSDSFGQLETLRSVRLLVSQ